MKEAVGIIAGGGKFPLMIADAAKSRGFKVVAVALLGETDPLLEEKADETAWIRLGQLGRLIKVLKTHGVRRALMAGPVSKKKMFYNYRPDLKCAVLLSKLAVFHDDDILRAFAEELAAEGIEILGSTTFLPDLLAPPGCFTKRKPSRSEKQDLEFGWRIAKELGRLDIGQCVVVRKKTVLALEAIDGTDATILRGGKLAREKAVVVKVSKPNQDLRFDVPAVGVATIEVMSKVNATVLAIEANKTLLFDKEKMISLADRSGISIVSRS